MLVQGGERLISQDVDNSPSFTSTQLLLSHTKPVMQLTLIGPFLGKETRRLSRGRWGFLFCFWRGGGWGKGVRRTSFNAARPMLCCAVTPTQSVTHARRHAHRHTHRCPRLMPFPHPLKLTTRSRPPDEAPTSSGPGGSRVSAPPASRPPSPARPAPPCCCAPCRRGSSACDTPRTRCPC